MNQFDKGIQIVDKTMKEMGIKYAFISGTALGLGRDGKCLPFDTDIDFCIHTSERPQMWEIVNALQKNGLNPISEMPYNGRMEAIGFEIRGGENEWVEMDFVHTRGDQVWYSADAKSCWITKVYPKSMWDNLEFIEAYGVKCPVFSPIKEYLRMCYGSDWRVERPKFWQDNFFPDTQARNYKWDLTED